MNNCCGNSKSPDKLKKSLPRKFACPLNARQYSEVARKTILQHIHQPWQHTLDAEKYYFCDDPDCDVVYFGLDGSTICKEQLRTRVGIKEQDANAPVCYCFGVSKALASKDHQIREFVIRQTQTHHCACDIRNPSGRCCLKDFPKKH